MEGGKEQNYWPGFVDALSNVVLTLVFVLVIFVFALLMASQKVSKKMAEATAAEQAHNEAQAQLNKALTELQEIRQKESQDTAASKAAGAKDACLRFAKSDDSQKSQADEKSILILFSANAISVTDDTTNIIHNFVTQYVEKNHSPNTKFVIEASDNPDSPSPLLARETQLGRLLNVRNTLLSGKVEPRNISIRNIDPQKQSDTYDWVKIVVEN